MVHPLNVTIVEKELENLKQELANEIGDDMDLEAIRTEFEKKISLVQGNLDKQLEDLRTQNSALLSQVEDLKAERESLLTLQKISNTINSVLDSQKLLNMIMDMVVKELRAERGFLVLKEGREGFLFKAARNIAREE